MGSVSPRYVRCGPFGQGVYVDVPTHEFAEHPPRPIMYCGHDLPVVPASLAEIISVLKTGKTPSAKRGPDATGIPKRAVPFGVLAVGACCHRLDRHGQPIMDITYARADTQQPSPSASVHEIHNAISFEKIDARAGAKPRTYMFDDWLLVMPID